MTEQKLIELLRDMSLEEKVNQMSQVTGGFFNGEIVVTGPMEDKGFTEDNVNLAGSVIGSMGAETLKSIQKNYMEKHPHHIPLLFMLDVINGYKTVFPIPLAQGASFVRTVCICGSKGGFGQWSPCDICPYDRSGQRCKVGTCHGINRRRSLPEQFVLCSNGAWISGKQLKR